MGVSEPSRAGGEADGPRAPGRAAPHAGRAASPARRGGKSAVDFAARFAESYRLLWLVAVGIVGERSAAEDVVQEAALLALEKLDQFEVGTNFRAWMAQMVRYVALNHARRRQKHRAAPIEAVDADVPLAASATTGGNLHLGPRGQLPADQQAFDDRLLSALNSVGEVARACLLLRTVEQLEYSEISRILEIPEGTAMSHVHRTRNHLRQRLAGHEAEGLGASKSPGLGERGVGES
jgi:RNA polymerase sigma-70 factor, ECF subfamily